MAAASLVSHYDQLPEDIKEHWRQRARQAVPAAAPLIVAAELSRLADWADAEAAGTDGGFWDGMSGAADELRRRASVLRGEGDQK